MCPRTAQSEPRDVLGGGGGCGAAVVSLQRPPPPLIFSVQSEEQEEEKCGKRGVKRHKIGGEESWQ